jgi:hypothetical protein
MANAIDRPQPTQITRQIEQLAVVFQRPRVVSTLLTVVHSRMWITPVEQPPQVDVETKFRL